MEVLLLQFLHLDLLYPMPLVLIHLTKAGEELHLQNLQIIFLNKKKKEIEGERNKLLNDKISEIIIGIEPIGKELGHKITYYGRYAGRALLPTYLGGASIIHHLSCLITLRDSKETVILEYDAYHWGETGYDNYIHYI